MCSVSISEQEPSQIDTVAVIIMSVAVAGTGSWGILTTHMADNHGYAHSVET